MQDLHYKWPFLPISGSVIDASSTDIFWGDLKKYAGSISVGIYDYDTLSVATGNGNGKKFFIGYSSEHTRDKLDTFLTNMTLPKGRNYWAFKGSDVESFEYSDPITKIVHESWALGYSGADGCELELPKFECDKIYGVKVILDGNPVLNKLGSKIQAVSFADPICCNSSECTTGCQDGQIDCEGVMKQIAERLNNQLVSRLFNLRARYITNTFTPQSTFDLTKYQITLLDDGSNDALAKVQRNSPVDSVVKRVSRSKWYSTYEICTAGTPVDISAETEFILPADCETCPPGSTTVAVQRTYNVVRVLAPSDDINSDVDKQTYATAVAASYSATLAKTFDGTAGGVTVGTDSITVTAHGFSTGDKVTYSNGGGTSITGLTSGNDYFVIVVNANTVKLASSFALAKAGTAIDLTVVGVGTSHSLTPKITGKFNSSTGGVAIVVLTTSNETVLTTAINSDSLSLSSVSPVSCSLPSNTCFAGQWVEVGQAYRVQRQLCLTLRRKDCDPAQGDRQEELEQYYKDYPYIVQADGVAEVTVTAGDACEDIYTIKQWSKGCMEDACLAADTSEFEDLGGYDNRAWKVVSSTPPSYDADKRCGIIVTVSPTKEYYEECEYEFGANPEIEPITFELSWITDSEVGDFGSVCNFTLPAAKKITTASGTRQQGHAVLYQYIKTSEAYDGLGKEPCNPTLRRVLDSNYRAQVPDKSAFYRYYYLKFKTDRGNNNWEQKPEFVEATFQIPISRPDKMMKFEQAILSPLSKFGVGLVKRED